MTDGDPPFDGKPCPMCPHTVRGLAALVHNLLVSYDANRRDPCAELRAKFDAKMAELRDYNNRVVQPLADAHFADSLHAYPHTPAAQAQAVAAKAPPPVDRSARAVVGQAVAPGMADTTPKPNGQQSGYVVLTEEERAKGFVRPVRRSYVHDKCGAVTTMGVAIAETYARDPAFYSGTFCVECGAHFPVGAQGEFVWAGTNIRVGT